MRLDRALARSGDEQMSTSIGQEQASGDAATPSARRADDERIRRLAENVDDVIFVYRLLPTPGYEYVSPSCARITGYTAEDHYADPFLAFKLIHPDDRELIEDDSPELHFNP